MLLVSETESFSTDAANLFVACEQEPRFNLRGTEDIAESENAATIVAANALRTHQNIAVSRNANVANGLFVNRVHVCDQHNRSLSANENEISLADERFAVEFFAETLEELPLSWTQKVFQGVHAGTSLL